MALLCAQGCLCAARVGFLPHGMSRDELSVAVCQVCATFSVAALVPCLTFSFLFVCLFNMLLVLFIVY